MENFSNETKSKRRKAILKVILKRYSFIVWVPALLVVLNFIGMIAIKCMLLIDPLSFALEGGKFYIYSIHIMMGFSVSIGVIIMLMFVYLIIGSFIKYLKKGTIVQDFIENIKLLIEVLVDIFCFFITIPKRIFLRIKDEKRRFNNSLKKELGEDSND